MKRIDYIVLAAGLISVLFLLLLRYGNERIIDQSIAFLTLIATAGLFLSTYALWCATRDLVTGAEKTAMNQLRAYVFIKYATIETIGIGRRPTITITFRNSGQTPAYHLRSVCRIDFIRLPPSSSAFSSKEGDAELDLGSEAESFKSVTWRRTMDQSIIEDIQARRGALFVWGRVDYTDAFGRKQFLQYRLHYRGAALFDKSILEPYIEGNFAS